MDYQLSGKKAFVSGSSAGIGLAIAELLAGEGAHVILSGRHEEALQVARKSIMQKFPSALVDSRVCDFSQRSSVESLLSSLSDIDILVNNVGVFSAQTFAEMTDEEWYRHFEVNVMSGVRLSRHLLPTMLARGWGRIIFISSECAQLVPQDLIAYSMTKAALHAIARGLAQSTTGTAVTVNTVMPGSTLSEGAKRFLDEQAARENKTREQVASDFFQRQRSSSLIARFTSTMEIAQAVTYLASPLSSATNGSVLKAEGGSVMGIF